MPKSIIIIGAGIGGLSAAIRLAHAGYSVTVLEKNPRVGGKIYRYELGGFQWDTGPAFVTMRPLLEEIFAAAGQSMADRLRLLPIDPLTRYFFPDGTSFDAQRDWAETAAQIERLALADVEGFLRFLAEAARLHLSGDPLAAGRGEEGGLIRSVPWLRAGARPSASRAIARYVSSENLRRALEHFTADAGANPFRAPAALNAVAHRALTGGAWYPQDGPGAIPRALERLAAESGVNILLNCPVRQIAVKQGAAIGVAIGAEGQFLPADAVVSNVDALSTLRYLLPPNVLSPPALRRLNRAPVTASAYVIMLGIRGAFPQLAHHNVLFSADARREYDQLHRQSLMPEDPTISLTISSKTDPLHAPVNQENWLIRVNAPPLSEKYDWAARHDEFRDRLMATLMQRYALDLSGRIRSEIHLTPADWGRMTGAWRGSLYGLSPENCRALFGRPVLQAPNVARLYFVGGTAHPGGGLPMALLSAKLATSLIQAQVN